MLQDVSLANHQIFSPMEPYANNAYLNVYNVQMIHNVPNVKEVSGPPIYLTANVIPDIMMIM